MVSHSHYSSLLNHCACFTSTARVSHKLTVQRRATVLTYSHGIDEKPSILTHWMLYNVVCACHNHVQPVRPDTGGATFDSGLIHILGQCCEVMSGLRSTFLPLQCLQSLMSFEQNSLSYSPLAPFCLVFFLFSALSSSPSASCRL